MKGVNEELRIMCFWILDYWLAQGWHCPDDIRTYLEGVGTRDQRRIAECYLLSRIRQEIGLTEDDRSFWQNYDYNDLFQENLRSQHLWLDKITNLDILKERFKGCEEKEQFIYAVHLLNMLRLNSQQEVFWRAGEDLVEIMPHLHSHQKFEIIQEILKAIELRDDASNYIPAFFGRTFLLLGEDEQKEVSHECI